MHPISFRKVSKTYYSYRGPRAMLSGILLGRSTPVLAALNDVSFELAPGQALGIVGDNGAGKSTLLKIVCGTCQPTSGQVEVNGAISSLLELGMGFHPEFTGRENIRFSALLHGFDPNKAAASEEEIIAFSELDDAIDRPVKEYSSGMFVRLGFSVATGFDPDILVIDEALSVGDQHFQKKCTDRIMRFRTEGKTILFCSHNLHQVKMLCDLGLWIDRGAVRATGEASRVVREYQDYCRSLEGGDTKERPDGIGGLCRIESVSLAGVAPGDTPEFRTGQTLNLDISASFSEDFSGQPGIGVALVRNDGVVVFTTTTHRGEGRLTRLHDQTWGVRLELPELPLLAGSYSFNVFTTDQDLMQSYDGWDGVARFKISQFQPQSSGLTQLQHRWHTPPAL